MKNVLKKAISILLVAVMVFGAAPLAGFVGLELPEMVGLGKLADSVSEFFADLAPKVEAATSGTCGDNLTWTFDESTGELVISGTGDMWDFSEKDPWLDYREKIKTVTVGDGVTSIGYSAFGACTSFTDITLPDSLKIIDEAAFVECTGLTSITLPDGLTSIGRWAFENCTSLKSITLPKGLKSIGEEAFSGCTGLTEIVVDYVGTCDFGGDNYTFKDCDTVTTVIIGDEVTRIENYAFSRLKNLKNVEIGSGVTSVGAYAFASCYSLTDITIPDNVTSIGECAFFFCHKLENVTIPDSVTSIGTYAFGYCMAMESLHIPSSVTSIGQYMQLSDAEKASAIKGFLNMIDEDFAQFHDEKGLTREEVLGWSQTTLICSDSENSTAKTFAEQNGNQFAVCNGHDGGNPNVPDTPENPDLITGVCGDNLTWTFDESTGKLVISGTGDMYNTGYSTRWSEYKSSIKSVIISDGVTSIGLCAFQYCNNLKSVSISDSVTRISSMAFHECSKLESVTIPDSVTFIHGSAFADCTSLKTAILPNGITSIENGLFSGCISLEGITIPDSVTTICGSAFSDCSSLRNITIHQNVTDIDEGAFSRCTSLVSIAVDENNPNYSSDGNGAFFNKNKTKLIQYPAGNTRISYIIPDSVITIDDYAFYGCTSLVNVEIPDSVITIEESAFRECAALTSIIIPDSVTSIGEDVFRESSLTKAVIGNGLTSISFRAFNECSMLETVVFGDSVTSIAQEAFIGCYHLKSITIPDGVTSIGEGAFYCCVRLENITIPDSVTSIDGSAFFMCMSMDYIHIPSSVSFIGEYIVTWDSLKTEYVDMFENASDEQLAGFDEGMNLTREDIAKWLPTTLICSDSENSAAKTFAEENGNQFSVCNGHDGETPNVPDTPENPDLITGVCGDNLTWTFDESTGELVISGTGDMWGWSALSSIPWYSHHSSIKTVTISDSVTSIGEKALAHCDSLANVTIPDSVTSIGFNAFGWCESLVSVTIGNGVTSISSFAFISCNSLISITVDSSNTSYSSDEYGVLFNKNKTVLIQYPAGNTRTSYAIPDSVEFIIGNAFYHCKNLTSVIIPYSVIDIGNDAFSNCESLTSVIIPDSVLSIGSYAFYNCSSLVSVKISGSVTSIGERAFGWCKSLESITVDSTNTSYSSDEYGVLFNKDKTVLIQYPTGNTRTSCTIPDSVTGIEDSAFEFCANLTSVTIGNSVKSIGNYAFVLCPRLERIIIPDSVTTIGERVFLYCFRLEYIHISSSVTRIGDSIILSDSERADFIASFEDVWNNESEDTREIMESIGITPEASATWPQTLICSDSENSTAKTFAEQNGNQFSVCNGHDGETPNVPDTPENPDLITGTCGDNLTWTLDIVTGELVIEGTGNMDDYYVFSIPWYNNMELIRKVRIFDGVTSIGKYAFNGCSNIVSVEIPDSVTSIGDYAFDDCSELVTIEISDNVTNIGEGVFGNCTSLTSITIDENNQCYSSDEYGVLFNKNKTELIQYPAGNTRTFYSIPVGVTDVGGYAFNGCTNLESIIIPDSIVKIGEGAFFECSGLKNVEIPDSVTDIGSVAFSECSNLTSVTLSNNITDIKFATFGQCYLLENITIPESVTSIGVGAFDGCISLESITIPDGVTSIGGSAFNGCENLISVTLSDNITSIDSGMFCGCKNLVSIEIPDGVTNIGNYAFYGCVRLENVILPDSVTYIGENAFCKCMAMDYIHIPSSVTQTGEEIILIDSHKAELIESFDNMSIEEIAKEIGLDNITREEIAGWSTSTLICSDSEDCFINLYANEFGNRFKVCGGDHREEFTVTFNIDGVQTVVTLREDDAIFVEDPVKEGHTFVEWTPAIPEVMPSENLEFTAVFEVNSYSVNWIIDGMMITETHKFGEMMDKSKSFEKHGYTFIGWSPEIPETMPAHDLEFTAIFEINICDAVFNANGGAFPDGDLVKRIATEQNAEIFAPENPERAGFRFAGWAYNGKNIGTNVGVMDSTEGKIFDAVWIPNEKTSYKVETYTMNTYGEYEVSYMLVNAFVSEEVSVNPTASEGFEINEEKSVLNGTVSSEEMLILKVYIDRKQYKFTTVVFDTETTVLYYYGAVVTGPDRPYIDGYVFQYWEPSVPVIMPPHDVTVTAKFRETTPKPRIEMVTPEKRTIYYGESITLQVRTYDMPSYAKIKWEVSGDGVSIKPSSSGKTCKVTSTSNGNVVIKAYIVDSDGNTIDGKGGKPIYDFEYLYSEVNLWQIIVNFFRQLFGLNDSASQTFRGIL